MSLRRWRGAAFVGAGLIAVALGGVLWQRAHDGGTASSTSDAGSKRLAVLPFENLGDSSDAYFADGVTDAIRDKLTSLGGFEVIASSSSRQYRHTTKPLQQIARELGTQYLLTGRVRWAKAAGGPSRVQVRPELVDAANGSDGQPRAASAWPGPHDAAPLRRLLPAGSPHGIARVRVI
jgi:TolB-like protein